jgi:hypothetical protein
MNEWMNELLADIIWWIKGYNAGLNKDITPDLDYDHIETLRQVRLNLHKLIKGE